LLSIMT